MKRAVAGGILIAGLSTVVRLTSHKFGLTWSSSAYVDDIIAGLAVIYLIKRVEKLTLQRQSFEDHVRNALQIVKFMSMVDDKDRDYLLAIAERFEKALHKTNHENVVCPDSSDVSKASASGTP